jgi:hypothetical protein
VEINTITTGSRSAIADPSATHLPRRDCSPIAVPP